VSGLPFGEEQVVGFFLVLGRVSPLFLLAPLFSSKLLPVRARGIVAVALAIGIAPIAAAAGAPLPRDLWELAGLMLKEMLVGGAFAFALAALFAAAQFVPSGRTNPPVGQGRSIESHVRMTPEVAGLLERSCDDCHSNRTDWPWYSNVAPASWFVIDHVNHGRSHLNFSEWGKYSRRDSVELLNGICATTKGGSMPLDSYTLVHRGARLGPRDWQTLCKWAGDEQERIVGVH
jgi:hypothetical protein